MLVMMVMMVMMVMPYLINCLSPCGEAGEAHGIWTGVCGEMAGDIRLTPLLLGLGVEELSVSPKIVPRVGQVIRSLKYSECQAMADEVMKQTRSQHIMDLSMSLAKKCYPDLLD